jgi:hypothetical protein
MRGLRFQIRHPHGAVDGIDVEADRAVLGSGAHCEIRLAVDQAKIEHVRVELGPNGVYATAIAFDPPPTINGVSFTQGPIPPESILGIGQTQILVQPVEIGGPAKGPSTKGTSPLTVVALLVILAGIWLMFFNEEAPEESLLTNLEPPALWPAERTSTCAQNGPQALSLAREQFNLASNKRERRPFYVQDGVASVPHFDKASACYRVGGDGGRAKYCESVSAYMRADLERDYKKQRVKLEYHVRSEDWTGARRDIRALLAFTEGQNNDYRQWLQQTDRKLQLKATRENGAQ